MGALFNYTVYYISMSLVIFANILFGLIIGSFLNVVLLRHGARSISGRSGCMSCGTQLKWYDMVPLLSWFFLRGRCRVCHTRISAQYPLVESLNALGYGVIAGVGFPMLVQIVSFAIFSLLLIIAVYDLRHTIIPDEWVYTFAILALLNSLVIGFDQGIIDWIPMLAAGPVCALPFCILWAVSHGEWMGLGDAKLALGIGWLLGFLAGAYAIFLAFVIGAVISVCILLPLPYLMKVIRSRRLGERTRSFTMKSEVAFGPFLVSSTVIVWFALMYQFSLPLLSS